MFAREWLLPWARLGMLVPTGCQSPWRWSSLRSQQTGSPAIAGAGKGATLRMSSLLADRVIRVRNSDGSTSLESLPGTYEAMVSDRVEGFPALRPHQRHAWHAFLAQLAAMALCKSGRRDLPSREEEWLRVLRRLTPGFPGDEPWRLLVDDHCAPGFMQCPVSDLNDYKKPLFTPDDLDLLVTSKNHDEKSSIATEHEADDWIFALVSLQTMGGFLGAGNYGIARMNGGYSSRPCLGLAPARGGLGAHLAHDISQLLAGRQAVLDRYEDYYVPDGGIGLLWLEPWDGTRSFELKVLDPYFVEICRRVRLEPHGRRIMARVATSRKPRIAAKHAKGDLGDHWTPVSVGTEVKALSVTQAGFRYDQLCRLVLDRAVFRHPPAMTVGGSPHRSWRLVARAVAGGQGKTEGYHERTDVVFRPSVLRLFAGQGAKRDALEELAKLQLQEIKEVATALRLGIATAASGGEGATELRKSDWEKAVPFTKRLDEVADAHFFEALQERCGVPPDVGAVVRRNFVRALIRRGEGLVREGVSSVPCTAIHRYRAEARALSAYHSRLRRSDVLRAEPDVFEARGEDTDTDG